MTESNRSGDDDLLMALRHPLRRRILRKMAEVEPISPRELAAALREPLSNVSYHVRSLAEHNAIVLVRTKQVRGSTQHFYCSTVDAPWAQEILRRDEEATRGQPGEKPKDPEP